MDSPTLLETHFDEFFLAVRRCLLRRVLDPELADELTAETFFRAARRVDQLPAEPQRIQMWLFRIATNVAISFFRKSSTTRAMLHRFSARSLAAATRRCDSAGDDEQACLRGLIRKLPPNYQSVVVLRYFAVSRSRRSPPSWSAVRWRCGCGSAGPSSSCEPTRENSVTPEPGVNARSNRRQVALALLSIDAQVRHLTAHPFAAEARPRNRRWQATRTGRDITWLAATTHPGTHDRSYRSRQSRLLMAAAHDVESTCSMTTRRRLVSTRGKLNSAPASGSC